MTRSSGHATVDNKGRVLIPDSIRRQLDIHAGDVLFVQVEDTGAIRYMRPENPFEILAEHALRESKAGRTRLLRDIAKEEGIDLDGE